MGCGTKLNFSIIHEMRVVKTKTVGTVYSFKTKAWLLFPDYYCSVWVMHISIKYELMLSVHAQNNYHIDL